MQAETAQLLGKNLYDLGTDKAFFDGTESCKHKRKDTAKKTNEQVTA